MTTKAQVQGLGLFAQQGFTLEHPDDHVVILKHESETLVIFSQLGATQESIQAECANHLALCHHWNSCLWQGEANDG